MRYIEAGSTGGTRPSLVRSGRCAGTVPVKECARSRYIFVRQSDGDRYRVDSEMCSAVVQFRMSKGTKFELALCSEVPSFMFNNRGDAGCKKVCSGVLKGRRKSGKRICKGLNALKCLRHLGDLRYRSSHHPGAACRVPGVPLGSASRDKKVYQSDVSADAMVCV